MEDVARSEPGRRPGEAAGGLLGGRRLGQRLYHRDICGSRRRPGPENIGSARPA